MNLEYKNYVIIVKKELDKFLIRVFYVKHYKLIVCLMKP